MGREFRLLFPRLGSSGQKRNGGGGEGKLLLQGLRHSVLNARERMQQEGRNFKSSSRILQRDLRYARCYVRKQEIQSRFPDSPPASSRNCHLRFQISSHSDFKKSDRIVFFFPTRVIVSLFTYRYTRIFVSCLFHSPLFFSSRKI